MDDFYRKFKQEEVAVREVVNNILSGIPTEEERRAAIENSLTGISQLSEEVKNAAGRLPAHDLQNFTKAIDSLRRSVREVRSSSAPKKRFAFRKSEFPAPDTPLGPSESSPVVRWPVQPDNETDESRASPSKPVSQQPLSLMPTAHAGFRLSQLRATHYDLASPVHDGACTASLEDIRESFVDMSTQGLKEPPFAALMIHHLQKSLLICGKIAGSAHMTDVSNSTIVIAARQIRLHDCNDVVLYLQCSSRPIIENCKGIRFAPLPYTFDVEYGKELSDMWDQVDDFGWLRAEPSPNWGVLTTEDDLWINDEKWRDICDQRSKLGVKELLKLAKVQ